MFRRSNTGLVVASVLGLGLAVQTRAQPVVDGAIAGDYYGPEALAVQAVQTGFGNNLNELNAAWATIHGGRLYLALTGNIEANLNKLEIFIDSRPGGQHELNGIPGNDGAAAMTGLTFDAGFEADVHIIVRRGFDGSQNSFMLDIAELGTANFSSHLRIFGSALEGSGQTGVGPGNASPIRVAYSNANVAGITGGTGPANQAAALAVQTGLELSVSLSDLGLASPPGAAPAGDLRILAFINAIHHNYASNQFLGPIAPPHINLGGNGAGTFTGFVNFDLGDFAGEQYFTVTPPECPCDWDSSNRISTSDFYAFLESFFDGDADFNASGATDSSDFFDFMTCWLSGCD